MNIHDQLMANWEARYYTVVRTGKGNICIFSTKNEDGTLRYSGYLGTLEDARKYIGCWGGKTEKVLLECAKNENWKIINTIHPTELMGSGLKPGQKVRVKENAKEECEKCGMAWNEEMDEMVRKICEVMGRDGNDYRVNTPDKSDHWIFPPSALSPVYEDDTKTTWLEEGKKNGWVKDGNIVV